MVNDNIKFYNSFSRYFYTFAHYLALPIILLRLLWRSRYSKGYRQRWNERFGYIKRLPPEQKSIWVHAVSVGEVIAAIPLIKALIQQYSNYTVVVTTTTPTGSAQVIKHLNNQVLHVYSPYDVPSCVNRFLRRSNTHLCIIMETELWPNMLRCCCKRNIPILLANARLSESSMRKYQLITGMTKTMLSAYTMVAAQGLLDGERLIALGLDPNKLIISGNIKFDIHISETLIEEGNSLRKEWKSQYRPTFIGASTHEGEEIILLNAFKEIRKRLPNTLLILVPRHPDRFSKVARLCREKNFKIAQRSLNQQLDEQTDILLGDTMGELRLIYSASDIAFVGGSLVPIGGHNLIEPAAIGLPVLTGPYLQNFSEISKLLKNAGAAQIVVDAKSIASAVVALFSAAELREKISIKAREVIAANRGALMKHMEWITKNFPTSS